MANSEMGEQYECDHERVIEQMEILIQKKQALIDQTYQRMH